MLLNETSPGPRARLAEAALPWAAGLLLALPVLLAFYPPMTDLPLHEAAIGLLRHFGDPVYEPPGLYLRNLGEPNQLFHMAGWALSLVMSTRWAVKLVVAAAIVALPVSAARFARHVGASPLASLALAPMGLGWLFGWGLITNLIGLSVLLAALPIVDRLADHPTPRRALQAVGAVVLTYFAHEAMLFVLLGVTFALATLRPSSLRQLGLRVTPVLVGVAIAGFQLLWQERYMTATVKAVRVLWRTPLTKLKEVPYIILPATELPAQLAMLALTLLALASLLWLRARERRPLPLSGARLERARTWVLYRRWELVAAMGFTAFATFPVSLHGATLVHERWFPPAFAILTAIAAPRNLWVREARIARVALVLLPLATLLAVWPSFVDSDREYRALEQLIPLVEPGSAIVSLPLGPINSTRTYSLGPAGGRILAARGGRLHYAFTESPVSPIVMRRRYQWPEPLTRIGFDAWRFMPAHDMHRFRYLLVRSEDPGMRVMSVYVLGAECEYVSEAGYWILFRSKLPVVPLESPDVPLEEPRPDTLRQRVRSLLDRLRGSPGAPSVSVPPDQPPRDDGVNVTPP